MDQNEDFGRDAMHCLCIGDTMFTAKTAGSQVKGAKTTSEGPGMGIDLIPPPKEILFHGRPSTLGEILPYYEQCIKGSRPPSDVTIVEETDWRTRLRMTAEIFGPIPIKNLTGVGPSTQEILSKEGVETCADCLKCLSVSQLQKLLGKQHGANIHDLAQGIDRRVIPTPEQVQGGIHGLSGADGEVDSKKTLTIAVNWGVRLSSEPAVLHFLHQMAEEAASRIEGKSIGATYLHIKILVRHPDAPINPVKFGGCGWCNEFTKRSEAGANLLSTTAEISACAQSLWRKHFAGLFAIEDMRGVTFVMSKFKRSPTQSQATLRSFNTRNATTQSTHTVAEEQKTDVLTETAQAPRRLPSDTPTRAPKESPTYPSTQVSQRPLLLPQQRHEAAEASRPWQPPQSARPTPSPEVNPQRHLEQASAGLPASSVKVKPRGSLPELVAQMKAVEPTPGGRAKLTGTVQPFLGRGPKKRAVGKSESKSQPKLEAIFSSQQIKSQPVIVIDSDSDTDMPQAKRRRVSGLDCPDLDLWTVPDDIPVTPVLQIPIRQHSSQSADVNTPPPPTDPSPIVVSDSTPISRPPTGSKRQRTLKGFQSKPTVIVPPVEPTIENAFRHQSCEATPSCRLCLCEMVFTSWQSSPTIFDRAIELLAARREAWSYVHDQMPLLVKRDMERRFLAFNNHST
eukprot:Blabericola_migrator_1__3459@NODE_2020_length_3410_cov_68_980856_g1283_i0_p1_GENE_NODE_2020_length_3410_cov_68_980856_g1283_i0NODE_2020_length_3410_cov_68_980856_g1283_i0_p1_ORF_typecomplete_len679_score117_53IMS_C/PF11799_8/0_011_NODE_2020_length_3410_cov_68_980856_g1283_i013273363